jgi:pimeloyl-ACP methyl ester carboxylesterase
MVQEAARARRRTLSTSFVKFENPYIVIQCQDDWFVPTSPARSYFDKVVAPRKRMVVIEGAGHFALVTHPHAFLQVLEQMLGGRQTDCRRTRWNVQGHCGGAFLSPRGNV